MNLKSFAILMALLLGAACVFTFVRRNNSGPEVIVYTSVDEEFAIPLFEKFTQETGIRVVRRTDSESSKTTGMAQRLLIMKDLPDGDVFWNSELSQSQLLAEQNVFESYASPNAADIPARYRDPQSRWTGFGCRARVIVFNTDQVKREEAPRSLEDFADPRWKGSFTVAKPHFGTTRSHLVALTLAIGEERAFKLFRAWRANGVVIAESNGDVRNRVANGLSKVGLTDTDDAYSALDRKKPVGFVVADQAEGWRGAFLIPNTVAILKNCGRPAEAKLFVDFLLRPTTEKFLAEGEARQIPVRDVGAKIDAALQNLKPAEVDNVKLGQSVMPLGERIYRILSGEE